MSKNNNLDFARLVEWLDGELSVEESQQVVEALPLASEETKADAAFLQRFQQASQEVKFVAPPASVREVLSKRFDRFAKSRQPDSLLQRLKAILTFDSGTQWATAGIRSTVQIGRPRQLIFNADTTEIALNIQPRRQDHRLNISGQVFAITEADYPLFAVQLIQDEHEVSITSTDDLGEFAFEALESGEYEMVVSGDQFEVLITPLSLQL